MTMRYPKLVKYLFAILSVAVVACACQKKQVVRQAMRIEKIDGPGAEAKEIWRQMHVAAKMFSWPTHEQLPGYRATQNARSMPLPQGISVKPELAGEVPVEWIAAEKIGPTGLILYLHGGGYVTGSLTTHRFFCSLLSRASHSRVLSVGYRLAPEHPYPAALDDAKTVYRWLLDAGHPPESIVLAGDSAGGGLAVALLVALRSEQVPLPSALALISPWTDLAMTGKSVEDNRDRCWLNIDWTRKTALAYAGEGNLKNPLVSPVYADLSGLPPVLIQTSTDEILADDARRLARRAHQAGVWVTLQEFTGLGHGFQVVAPTLPESRKALTDLGAFLERHLTR